MLSASKKDWVYPRRCVQNFSVSRHRPFFSYQELFNQSQSHDLEMNSELFKSHIPLALNSQDNYST